METTSPENPAADNAVGMSSWVVDSDALRTVSVATSGRAATPKYEIPFALAIVSRVIVDGEVGGLRVAKRSSSDTERRVVYVPVQGIDGSTRSAQPAFRSLAEPMTPSQSSSLIAWLGEAARVPGVKTEVTLSRPVWEGDKLLIPGINALAAPGALVLPAPRGGAQDALDAWRYVVETARKYPTLGVLIGAAVGSIYLKRLGVNGSIWDSAGDSTKGKTFANETAIAAVGDPKAKGSIVRDNWNTTTLALAKRLSDLGCIPILLDETSTATNRPEQLFKDAVFMVSDGVARSRLKKDASRADDAPFTLNLLSTGEEPLVDGGATGGFARVHGIRFPLTDSPEGIAELDLAHAHAVDFAGWPLRWLLKMPPPQRDDLHVPTFESPLAQRHAEALAAARLGFRLLCRVLGLAEDLDLTEVVANITDDTQGKSAPERLREALWEDFVANPDLYSALASTRLRGRWLDEESAVAYLPETVKEIAKREGVGVMVAMRGLKRAGVLSPGDGEHLARNVRFPAGFLVGGVTNVTRAYVLAALHEREAAPIPETRSQEGPDV